MKIIKNIVSPNRRIKESFRVVFLSLIKSEKIIFALFLFRINNSNRILLYVVLIYKKILTAQQKLIIGVPNPLSYLSL